MRYRILDFPTICQREHARLGDRWRALVDGMAGGVNGAIERFGENLPVEFDLLGYKPEDAEGWRVVARGRGKGKMPRIGVEVHFDDAQSAWLRAEAERRGLAYTEVVKRLVDEARAKSAQPPSAGHEASAALASFGRQNRHVAGHSPGGAAVLPAWSAAVPRAHLQLERAAPPLARLGLDGRRQVRGTTPAV